MSDDEDSPYSKQDLTIHDRWPTAGNVGNPKPSRVVATILALDAFQKNERCSSDKPVSGCDCRRCLLRNFQAEYLAHLELKVTTDKLLEDLRERCAEEARAHARHDMGLEVLKANSIGLAVRKVPLTEPNEKGKERSDV